MTDPAIIAHLREHVAAQAEALEIMQAARRAPIEVRLMECVLGIAVVAVVVLLVALLVQGFTLYDGLHVPGLLDWWSWRRSA